jgi:hypothetical protein
MQPDKPAAGRESLGYIVVTYDKTGRHPWVGFLLASLDEARARRAESVRISKTGKRDERHVVAEVFEVEEGTGAPAVHDAGVEVAEARGRLMAVTAERDDLAREVARLRAEITRHGGWPILPPKGSRVES